MIEFFESGTTFSCDTAEEFFAIAPLRWPQYFVISKDTPAENSNNDTTEPQALVDELNNVGLTARFSPTLGVVECDFTDGKLVFYFNRERTRIIEVKGWKK